MIPAPAFLMLSELTARLRKQSDDDRHQTRRVIGKLAAHFYPFINDTARSNALASITYLLTHASDDRLAFEALSACARHDFEERRHRRMMQSLNCIGEIGDRVKALAAVIAGANPKEVADGK